jgi:CBS domain containing-hemolysin-like protein
MVVDEFGGTAGLVTIHDLTAAILGTAADPASTEELSIQILDDQMFLVEAQIDLAELNELLGLDLPLTDEYQTLAGFILYQLQKIPQTGEVLAYGAWEFTVAAAEGPRLLQVCIRRVDLAEFTDPETLTAADQAPDRPPEPTSHSPAE